MGPLKIKPSYRTPNTLTFSSAKHTALGDGELMGKKVIPMRQAELGVEDCLVLAVAAKPQKSLYKRFSSEGLSPVTWYDWIAC